MFEGYIFAESVFHLDKNERMDLRVGQKKNII